MSRSTAASSRPGLRWPLSTRQMWLFERPIRAATCETGASRHGLRIVSNFFFDKLLVAFLAATRKVYN